MPFIKFNGTHLVESEKRRIVQLGKIGHMELPILVFFNLALISLYRVLIFPFSLAENDVLSF